MFPNSSPSRLTNKRTELGDIFFWDVNLIFLILTLASFTVLLTSQVATPNVFADALTNCYALKSGT